MKNQYIEMTTQIKTEEELDVIPAEDADNAEQVIAYGFRKKNK